MVNGMQSPSLFPLTLSSSASLLFVSHLSFLPGLWVNKRGGEMNPL